MVKKNSYSGASLDFQDIHEPVHQSFEPATLVFNSFNSKFIHVQNIQLHNTALLLYDSPWLRSLRCLARVPSLRGIASGQFETASSGLHIGIMTTPGLWIPVSYSVSTVAFWPGSALCQPFRFPFAV
jgi:hypothetical protein